MLSSNNHAAAFTAVSALHTDKDNLKMSWTLIPNLDVLVTALCQPAGASCARAMGPRNGRL